MQNGITRLYKAIWYTQVGRALEQKDLERANTENIYDSLPDDFETKQENNRHNIQRKSISDNTEFWRNFNSQSNTSGIVVFNDTNKQLDNSLQSLSRKRMHSRVSPRN